MEVEEEALGEPPAPSAPSESSVDTGPALESESGGTRSSPLAAHSGAEGHGEEPDVDMGSVPEGVSRPTVQFPEEQLYAAGFSTAHLRVYGCAPDYEQTPMSGMLVDPPHTPELCSICREHGLDACQAYEEAGTMPAHLPDVLALARSLAGVHIGALEHEAAPGAEAPPGLEGPALLAYAVSLENHPQFRGPLGPVGLGCSVPAGSPAAETFSEATTRWIAEQNLLPSTRRVPRLGASPDRRHCPFCRVDVVQGLNGVLVPVVVFVPCGHFAHEACVRLGVLPSRQNPQLQCPRCDHGGRYL